MRMCVVLALTAEALLGSGCILVSTHKGYPPPPPTPAPVVVHVPVPDGSTPQEATAADLKSRMEAAETISNFVERDAAMASIARLAAQCSDIQTAKASLQKISAFPTRDAASEDVSLILARKGYRAEAIEVAKSISAFPSRDRTLKRLAME